MRSIYPHCPIHRLVTGVTNVDPKTHYRGKHFDYIDIASIDRDLKEVVRPSRIPCDEAPSRAKQLAAAGDVLVSTVRPNLNAVAVVPKELDSAIASTGFCVLRANPKLASSRYLYHWVRTTSFVSEMERLATGASYPAISNRIVLESKIPAPDLPEQRRIADILDKADAIRRKRLESLEVLSGLMQSQFGRWFCPWFQPSAEGSHVPVSDFVTRFEGGLNVATRESPSPETRSFILKVSAVTSGDYRPEESKPLYPDYNPPQDHFVREGDLLFSRANTTDLVGATAFVFNTPMNRVLPDKLWRFVWKDPTRTEPLFIWALFNHPKVRYEIGKRATGTSGSMKNISMSKVMSIRVPCPDIEKQRQFSRFLAEHKTLRDKMASSLQCADDLFNSLVKRAFRGEL